MTRHFVHSGYVQSRTDGDVHWIGFVELCRLYRLNPHTAIDASRPGGMQGYRPEEGDKQYFPRADGKYPLFEEDDNG